MIYHKNEPREVGYAKEHEDYFRSTIPDVSFTHKDSKTIFAGLNLKDLFIFAMALGKYHNVTKNPVEIKRHVTVSAMSEQQKWALLAILLSEEKEILNLSDEKPFYTLAERYACAGMDILIDEMKKYGFVEYCNNLEKELLAILKI